VGSKEKTKKMVRGYFPPNEGVTAFTTYAVPTSPPWQMARGYLKINRSV
jgi:hypothetical protein